MASVPAAPNGFKAKALQLGGAQKLRRWEGRLTKWRLASCTPPTPHTPGALNPLSRLGKPHTGLQADSSGSCVRACLPIIPQHTVKRCLRDGGPYGETSPPHSSSCSRSKRIINATWPKRGAFQMQSSRRLKPRHTTYTADTKPWRQKKDLGKSDQELPSAVKR